VEYATTAGIPDRQGFIGDSSTYLLVSSTWKSTPDKWLIPQTVFVCAHTGCNSQPHSMSFRPQHEHLTCGHRGHQAGTLPYLPTPRAKAKSSVQASPCCD
jgi:hypothetical protein